MQRISLAPGLAHSKCSMNVNRWVFGRDTQETDFQNSVTVFLLECGHCRSAGGDRQPGARALGISGDAL